MIMKKRIVAILLLLVTMTLFASSAFAAESCSYCNGGKIMRHYHPWVCESYWHGYKNGVRGLYRTYNRDVTLWCNKCHHIYAYLDEQRKTEFFPGE